MKKSLKIGLFSLLAMFSMSAQADGLTPVEEMQQKYKQKKAINIVQFGDSHSIGVFPTVIKMTLRKYNPNINYTAYGKNGAILFNLDKDQPKWKEQIKGANLVILAFGSNEAIYPNFYSISHQKKWLDIINYIKEQNAEVLILETPNIIPKSKGQCIFPTNLKKVQETQENTAIQTHSYYWKWNNAMGNECAFVDWQKKGLARKDGVHLNMQGYQNVGRNLGESIIKIIKGGK